MIRKFNVVGPAGIMPERTVCVPGTVAEIDDGDPRVALWLEDGTIVLIEEPERKKPGPKPKKEEGE